MRKPRDYKAEYAARKQRALKQGYSGYGQQRKTRKKLNKALDIVASRMANELAEFFEQEEFGDDTLFWQALREWYGSAETA